MTTKFKLIALALTTLLCNCKTAEKEKTLDEFKFSEKGTVLNCENFDLKLLNEAVFSFENDIMTFYGKDKPNMTRVYSQFINNATYNRVKYAEIVSPHTLKIFEVLKSKSNLWNPNSTVSKLDYNSPLFNCITDNMTSKDLNTTLNALISTNSMSPKIFGPAVRSDYSRATNDKYLAAYLAFDFFYARLFDVDLKQITAKQDQNAESDPHAGHNH